jgi:hypothetical protein
MTRAEKTCSFSYSAFDTVSISAAFPEIIQFTAVKVGILSLSKCAEVSISKQFV